MKFYPVIVPQHYAREMFLRGHRDVRLFAARAADGELRVIVSMDPNRHGRLVLHVSASVGKPPNPGAFRAPTDNELAAVQARFCSEIDAEEVAPEQNPHVRHLWQRDLRPGEPKV